MAEEQENKEGQQEGTQEGTQTQEPPKIDPRDEEIKQLKMNFHTLSQTLETNNQLLNNLLSNQGKQTPTPQTPQEVEISDEEIENAIQEGRGAGKLRSLMKAAISRESKRLIQEHIDPLRQTGLDAIAKTVFQITKPQMPYYDKYEKEIEGYLNVFSPELRLQPDAIMAAYHTVVGKHFEELQAERDQQKARKAAVPALEPKGRVVRVNPDEVEDPEEIAPGALSGLGMEPDVFAKKLGYKDWKEYRKINPEVGQ